MRIATPESLAWDDLVEPDDRVIASHMTAEPGVLLRSLAAASPHGGRFGVFLGVPMTRTAAAFAPSVMLTTFGGIAAASAIARTRPLRMLSTAYGVVEELFAKGYEPADVVLVGLARDARGCLMLGASHGHAIAAARRARTIVAEVNVQAPAVPGAPWPDDLPIDWIVEVDEPLPVADAARSSSIEAAIAERVASLVTDGACLQLGIGGLPSAVLARLGDHRGLGIHSGMLTRPLHDLVERGVVDNASKAVDAGTSVTGCVYGDAALYRAVDGAQHVRLEAPRYTHAPGVIAQLARFTAINSAIEVDLLGQINAEAVTAPDGSRRWVGGAGGLNDFMRAARRATEGRAIVALPSRQVLRSPTDAGEPAAAPRIVGILSGPATVAAADADVFVTEHGIAHVRETSLDERARRMIAIAHPDDRDALTRQARASGLAR